MTISVSCDECFQEYQLNNSLAGKKVKCKECGAVIKVPDDEALDDLEFLDDDDDDEKPRRKPSRGTSRVKSRAADTPPPIPTKRTGKSKKRGGEYRDAFDDIPTWAVLVVMWLVIGIMSILFWVLGARNT
ncbi:MAG: hypothetical protein JWM11_3921 [Planctomycetaceae bacterium]|nr:hypothetical protein [Planctomycetaceae bacterium]